VRGNGWKISLALACAWLALVASASAAPTWLVPKDIADPTQSITFPEVAVDAAGNAAAILPRDTGAKTIIEVAERPAGGDWAAPAVLSDPTEDENPTGAHIGLDSAGDAVAVWASFGAHGAVIRTALRPAGGDWSEAEDLSVEGGGAPQLAMNAAGDAVAVWTGFNGIDEVIWAATWSAGGDWSTPTEIPAGGELGGLPRVAIDAAGNALAIWERLSDGVIRAALRPAGGDWSTPEDVSAAGESGQAPRIAMNAAGTAVAAWTNNSGDPGVRAAVHPPGGDWSAPEDVSAAGEDTDDPEVAIDESGYAFAIWPRVVSGNRNLRAAMLPSGGEWSNPEDISAEAEAFQSYDLEVSSVAGVVATWTLGVSATDHRVQAAVRPPGGDWSGPEDLSLPGEDAGLPSLAFDATGDAVAIWGHKAGGAYVVQGSGYDYSAPRLNALQIPTTGTVGEPVSFAVSPFDVFPLGTTSWAFGDGSQAAVGNIVSHVYAVPGSYPVTVSAFDASGNVSTQTGTIAIAAAPNQPPPPPPPPPRPIQLSLRIEKEPLGMLMRTRSLRVAASVNEAANVTLSGRAKLKVGAKGKAQTRLVPVFATKRVRISPAVEGRVTLSLSKQGRKALESLSRVMIVIAGEARDDAGGTATKTTAHTLRAAGVN
jgi:PKD domain